ncbi:MAG: peptidoglycan DD-metalloendopeptidase family protein [Bacteroidetes bacterium]|nr:peptidoglycan DD-metalloendopeptidase family protein [Bacteroidota bacterium]MDA0859686.1 peptidoglycan DD-metalloendopeptidase family protein [Bacteroidota bacterium]MDA1317728.1 peptidoglycan DD-metalloendopeptidase family protein [Bacteroidota bacterium]
MKLKQKLIELSNFPTKVVASHIDFDKYISIDLSHQNAELKKIKLNSSESLSDYINNYLKIHSKKIAFGGFLEKREIYNRSSHFNTQNTENQRDIHLGIDLWCETNTAVFAALNGVIHSFKNNTAYGDYGPTIILEHCIDGITFYTLYGHLSLDSITNLRVGTKVKAAEVIGYLGTAEVNGDYPPHLHFQIINDLQGNFGDYPGVCSANELDFYKENCPDPNLILKLK